MGSPIKIQILNPSWDASLVTDESNSISLFVTQPMDKNNSFYMIHYLKDNLRLGARYENLYWLNYSNTSMNVEHEILALNGLY